MPRVAIILAIVIGSLSMVASAAMAEDYGDQPTVHHHHRRHRAHPVHEASEIAHHPVYESSKIIHHPVHETSEVFHHATGTEPVRPKPEPAN